MRKPLQMLLAVAVLLLGGATIFLYSQYQKSQSSNASLQTSNRDTQDQYAQTINAIAEIQDSLSAIATGDKSMPFEPSNLHSERRMAAPNGQEALERIGLLRASIDRNKKRIERLESELHHSGLKVSGLQKMVASLRKTTTEKEQQIAELSAQVGTLQTQVSGLSTQVAQVQDTVRVRDAVLQDRQHELATVYWVADTKQALSRSGLIEARGGLLGIGKTLKPSARTTDGSVFRTLDTDEQTVLQLPTAKAQVLTAQPLSSYELRLVNGKMELHILSPQDFRKVRQLVIVTA
jgi:cell division septum initiation protein DivIVA